MACLIPFAKFSPTLSGANDLTIGSSSSMFFKLTPENQRVVCRRSRVSDYQDFGVPGLGHTILLVNDMSRGWSVGRKELESGTTILVC
jgi:hypothetical protein